MQVTVRDVPVHYREVGSGMPVLSLHGRPSDHRLVMAVMEPIFAGRAGWRRLYPDLPGMGRTSGAAWIRNQDDLLELILAFLDALAPGERFCVVGASYGAFLARGVVHERRDEVAGVLMLVPAFPAGPADPLVPEPNPLVRDPDALAAVTPDETSWLTGAVVQTPELLRLFRERVKPGMATADRPFLDRISDPPGFSFDPDALAAPCTAPALILAGRQDANVGYRRAEALLDAYPRATLAILDRAGHRLAEEQPGLLGSLAREWLDRVAEAERTRTAPDGGAPVA